jgi:hypothetical protein
LLRYILRPPFAQKRLSLTPDGRVVYQLRRPWLGGATELILDPLDFLRRLTALLPRPYAHAVRYHGCFAGRSAARPLLPKPLVTEELTEETDDISPISGKGATSKNDGTSSKARRYRLPWHRLLLRVYHVDSLACPRCSTPRARAPMLVLAFLTDPPVLQKILAHLKLPTTPPPLAPARRRAATAPASGLFARVAPHPCESAGGFPLSDPPPAARPGDEEIPHGEDPGDPSPPIRPPPAEEPASG